MRAGHELVAERTAGRRINELYRRNGRARAKALEDAQHTFARRLYFVVIEDADAGSAPDRPNLVYARFDHGLVLRRREVDAISPTAWDEGCHLRFGPPRIVELDHQVMVIENHRGPS